MALLKHFQRSSSITRLVTCLLLSFASPHYWTLFSSIHYYQTLSVRADKTRPSTFRIATVGKNADALAHGGAHSQECREGSLFEELKQEVKRVVKHSHVRLRYLFEPAWQNKKSADKRACDDGARGYTIRRNAIRGPIPSVG